MENNKLIAEFMGGQYVDEHLIEFENFYSIKDIGGEFEYTNCFDSDNELKYHSSWDWLMPVVDKCFDGLMENDNWDDLNFCLNDALLTTNIDEVYKVVIKIIKQIK